MNRKKCIQIARLAMAGRKANPDRERGYTFHHGLRVARLAGELCRQISAPLEVSEQLMFVAALFHDVGKGYEPHGHYGAGVITRLLAGQLDDDELAAAGRIIREHNRRNKRTCWTASKIVQDADLLDHFGSHGIWLHVQYSAAHGRSGEQTLTHYNSRENLAYQVKSRKSLNFQISKLAFDRRLAMERQFMDRLAQETAGEL
jgi:uncharacterized protein